MIGMKRVVAAVLCALVALTIALYLLVVRPLLRPSDVTAVAESALVTEDLLLLGSINVKQAAFLEKWLLGAPQVTAVRGEPALPVADRTLFDHLRAAGVDARHDLDQVLYALYPTSAEAARHAVILVGRFNLGLGVKTVPPQGVLRIVADARDAGRATRQIKAWEQAASESRARWQEAMPSVATLYDSLKIHIEGARSTIEFKVDRALAANSQRVINELLAAALGGLGVRVSGPAAAPAAERIDTEPVVFVSTVAPASLPGYDPRAQFAEEVDPS